MVPHFFPWMPLQTDKHKTRLRVKRSQSHTDTNLDLMFTRPATRPLTAEGRDNNNWKTSRISWEDFLSPQSAQCVHWRSSRREHRVCLMKMRRDLQISSMRSQAGCQPSHSRMRPSMCALKPQHSPACMYTGCELTYFRKCFTWENDLSYICICELLFQSLCCWFYSCSSKLGLLTWNVIHFPRYVVPVSSNLCRNTNITTFDWSTNQ